MHVSVPLFSCGLISLMETSPLVGAPPLPPPLQRPLCSPPLPLGCKAYKEIGVLCCISSRLIVSPFLNLFLTSLKNSSGNQKVVLLIPEKGQINRYIFVLLRSFLADSPGQFFCHKESLDSKELSWLPWKGQVPPHPSPLASERGRS